MSIWTGKQNVQRDIDDIRAYYANNPQLGKTVVYDRLKKGYILSEKTRTTLTDSEVLSVCKILLESRSKVKEEMFPIIDKLLHNCVTYESKKRVAALIANEKFHYLEPHHGKRFVDMMWDISIAVYEHRFMRICYQKLKEADKVMRLIQPVGIMFSEYYFYLTAYICADEDNPRCA